MKPEALLDLLGAKRCVCRHDKRPQSVLCSECWATLPPVMQKAVAGSYGAWMKLPAKTRGAVQSLGLTGEEFFFVYECAVDWVTWTEAKAWKNARIILRGEV